MPGAGGVRVRADRLVGGLVVGEVVDLLGRAARLRPVDEGEPGGGEAGDGGGAGGGFVAGVAGALGDVVELAGLGSGDEGLDGLGLVLERGHGGGLVQG